MSSAYCTSRLLVDMNGADLDSAVRGCGDARGPGEGVVERGAIEDEVAAERLLHLRVRAVAHETLVLADTYRRRGRGRGQLVAADEDARCPRGLRELPVLLVGGPPLGVRKPLPPALVRVDQRQVLHRSLLLRSFRHGLSDGRRSRL